MPPLRRKLAAERDPCPDAETLSAMVVGAATDSLMEVVAGHLTRCPACAGLHSRLRSFERGIPIHDAEWDNTQKRLDNWLAGFLASEAAHRAGSVAASRPRWSGWRLSWVAAMAAVLLVAAVILIQRDTLAPPPPPIAARAALPIAPPPHLPVVPPLRLPVAPPPPRHAAAPRLAVSPSPPQVPEESGTAEQAANVAEPPPQPLSPAATADTSSTSRALGGIPPMSRARLPLQTPLPAPARARAAPASLRIEAGTAVWIRLSSVSRQAHGGFAFRGTLLLPVQQPTPAHVVVLDRGTEVTGSGVTGQGQTSLLIKDFVVHGVRYTLRNAGGGSGKTVQFNAGRVLELFLASASTYEQALK